MCNSNHILCFSGIQQHIQNSCIINCCLVYFQAKLFFTPFYIPIRFHSEVLKTWYFKFYGRALCVCAYIISNILMQHLTPNKWPKELPFVAGSQISYSHFSYSQVFRYFELIPMGFLLEVIGLTDLNPMQLNGADTYNNHTE